MLGIFIMINRYSNRYPNITLHFNNDRNAGFCEIAESSLHFYEKAYFIMNQHSSFYEQEAIV
jgi:hypothetical protein